MPAPRPFLVALRGDEAYARYLDELARRTDAPGRHALAERALAELGARHGLAAPRRMRPAHRPRSPHPDRHPPAPED